MQLKAQTFADSNSAGIHLLHIYCLMEIKIALKHKVRDSQAAFPPKLQLNIRCKHWLVYMFNFPYLRLCSAWRVSAVTENRKPRVSRAEVTAHPTTSLAGFGEDPGGPDRIAG